MAGQTPQQADAAVSAGEPVQVAVAHKLRTHFIRSLLITTADEHDMPVTMRHITALTNALTARLPDLLAPDLAGCPLTGRQLEVVRLVANGLADEEIAVRLGRTRNTVKGHVRLVMDRLGAESRTHVVALCMAAGWVSGVDIEPVKVAAPDVTSQPSMPREGP